MRKKPMELCLYTLGAGAFGVFIRWLQLQIAFNDEGLPDKSFFNVAVPVMIVIIVLMFVRFVDAYRNARYYLPDDFCSALKNPGRIHSLVRYAAGGMTAVGAILLLLKCEIDPDAAFLRVLSILGILAGVAHPLILGAANKGEPLPRRRLCILSAVPILFFSAWLITCYRVNDINPVRWSYAIEIIAACVAIIAFFRLAGFIFDAPSAWRALFFSMLGAVMCIMALADERYFGEQVMFIGVALMFLQYVWIICANLKRGEAPPEDTPKDGFERLH